MDVTIIKIVKEKISKTIMDDGPKPMKDMKPTKKNPNSADQFWVTHQSGYEERSKTSEDRMDRVHQHNSAYPKLRDEQDKRRSMVQIRTSKSKKNYTFDPKCEACIKLKQLAKLKKLNIKQKCQTITKKKYQRERKSRVKKRTRFQRSNKKSHNRKGTCRVQVKDNYTLMDIVPKNDELILDERKELSQSQEEIRSKDGVSNSVHTLNSPDTSDPSITSYNTFASMDHEPMV